MTDPFAVATLCNHEIHQLTLEFRSENDEQINGLDVTIKLKNAKNEHSQTTRNGQVHFSSVAAGQWAVSIAQASLLNEVEKYESRKQGEDSPVKKRAEKEQRRSRGLVQLSQKAEDGAEATAERKQRKSRK